MDYQSNSNKSKEEQLANKKPEKQLEKVVTGEVIQRPKPLGRRFKDIFLGGDVKIAMRYVLAEVLLPGLRNIVVDVTSKGVEKMVYGDSPRRVRSPAYRSYTQYNNPISHRMPPDPRDRPYLPDQYRRPMRSTRRDMQNIVVATRSEADKVVETLLDIVSQYEVASLADLYELLGLETSFTDHKWGWTYLNNVEIRQVRDGYLIDFPPVEEI